MLCVCGGYHSMLKLKNLTYIGNLCIRAAWAISLLWLVQVFLELSGIWNTYQNRVDSVYQSGYDFWGTLIVPQLFSFLQSVSGMLFYFCILFAVGNVLKTLSQPEETARSATHSLTLVENKKYSEEFEDEVSYESLD